VPQGHAPQAGQLLVAPPEHVFARVCWAGLGEQVQVPFVTLQVGVQDWLVVHVHALHAPPPPLLPSIKNPLLQEVTVQVPHPVQVPQDEQVLPLPDEQLCVPAFAVQDPAPLVTGQVAVQGLEQWDIDVEPAELVEPLGQFTQEPPDMY